MKFVPLKIKKNFYPCYSSFQVGCHKNFHICMINPFKIDDLNGSPEHALIIFVTTNLKTAVSLLFPLWVFYGCSCNYPAPHMRAAGRGKVIRCLCRYYNTVDPRLSEPQLSEPSIIRIQKQMKIIGSKFKKLSLHHHL